MVGTRRRKIHLYGGAGISSLGEVGLTQNADAQCTLEGREEAKWAEKIFMLNFSGLA